MPFVEVASAKITVHGGSPNILDWTDYGLKISIPEQSLEEGDTCQITATAIAQRPFIVPEESELISAVYAIEVSGAELLKPVTIEMEHCVDDEDTSCLHFFKASKNDLTFEQLEGGDFTSFRHGKIKLANFSNVGIFMFPIDYIHQAISKTYYFQLVLFQVTERTYRMELVITKNIRALYEVRVIITE